MSSSIWKDRYYELEATLEQILQAVARGAGSRSSENHSNTKLQILKVTKIIQDDTELICAVTDGCNLEFEFKFFSDKRMVEERKYNRLNCARIPVGAKRCVVSVRTYATQPPTIVTREAGL